MTRLMLSIRGSQVSRSLVQSANVPSRSAILFCAFAARDEANANRNPAARSSRARAEARWRGSDAPGYYASRRVQTGGARWGLPPSSLPLRQHHAWPPHRLRGGNGSGLAAGGSSFASALLERDPIRLNR